MMQRGWTVFLVLCWMTLPLCPACAQGKETPKGAALRLVEEFEGGRAWRVGSLPVVRLQGNYHRMGRQYGHLLRTDLKAMNERAASEFRNDKIPEDRQSDVAARLFARCPRRYKEFLRGAAETSGLTLQQHLILNALEQIPKFWRVGPAGRCSALVAWGEYTGGGPLVFGRNNDDTVQFKKFADHHVVTVLCPDDGSLPVAILNYVGVLYAHTGMNAAGLFLELNSGTWDSFYVNRVPTLVTLLSMLQDYGSLEELDAAMRSVRVDFSCIVTAADPGGACAFECPTFGVTRRPLDRPGLVASTNHFVDPTWDMARQDDSHGDRSTERRHNLITLGEKHRGRLDAGRMMEIFDMSLDRGGATVEGTICQVVAIPGELRWWVKVPGVQEWTSIDFKPLFEGR